MTRARLNRVEIRTPEGVVFAFVLAGPFTRFLAWLVDVAVIAGVGSVLASGIRVFTAIDPDWAQAVFVLATFVVSTGYGIAFEWRWRGQTLGKKILRLRVIDEGGLPLGFFQVLLRNLLRAVDVLPIGYLVGGASMFMSRRAQRLGDIAAGTIVVRLARTFEPDFDALFGTAENSLRDHRAVCARLRQGVAPALAGAGVEALLRRDALEPTARVELFQELAASYRNVTAIPHETIVGVPDEVFVRNVIEVVHRHPGEERTVLKTGSDTGPTAKD